MGLRRQALTCVFLSLRLRVHDSNKPVTYQGRRCTILIRAAGEHESSFRVKGCTCIRLLAPGCLSLTLPHARLKAALCRPGLVHLALPQFVDELLALVDQDGAQLVATPSWHYEGPSGKTMQISLREALTHCYDLRCACHLASYVRLWEKKATKGRAKSPDKGVGAWA